MTKASIVFSLILFSACASTPTRDKKASFTFDAIKQVFASNPSQKQILENYGRPDVKKIEGNKERWQYFDPATQFDRVQFIFNDSKTLVQLIWTPLPGEQELKIERIFEQYPTGYFKVTNRARSSKHSLQTDTTYSGESLAIFRDDARKEVQAIAWFAPATNSSDKQNPVTSR
jgi:hypothetical protein